MAIIKKVFKINSENNDLVLDIEALNTNFPSEICLYENSLVEKILNIQLMAINHDIKNIINKFLTTANNFEYECINREQLRSFKTMNKSDYKLVNYGNKKIEFIKKINLCYISPVNSLDTTEEYKDFLAYLPDIILCFDDIDKKGNKFGIAMANKKEKKEFKKAIDILDNIDSKTRVNHIFKRMIIQSKMNKSKCEFIKMFDENGNILPAYLNEFIRMFEFDNLIPNNVSTRWKKSDADRFKSLLVDNLITQDDYDRLEQFQIESKRKSLELKQRQEEEKRIKKAQEQEELKNRAHNDVKICFKKKNPDASVMLLKKIIDTRTDELKPEVVDNYTRNQLLKELNEINVKLGTGIKKLNKSSINYYLEKFDDMLFKKRIDLLINSFEKQDIIKIRNIIQSENDDLTLELKNILLSENYSLLNEEDIKKLINENIFSKYLIDTNSTENILLFPTESLINDEISKDIYTNNFKSSSVKNGLYQQLNILQTVNYQTIKSNITDAYHELLENNSQPYMVAGKLKGYRFGANHAKIGLFLLSVCEENKKILQDNYNLGNNGKVILIFGIGDVSLENNEQVIIEEIKKQGKIYANIEEYIYNIFANPFTDKTLKEADALICNGKLQIEEFKTLIDSEKTI